MAVRLGTFLKKAWAKEPVWLHPSSSGASLSFCPQFKYSIMINKATPYNYPVPIIEDESMPNVPSHPQDPQGPSLEWLNNL
ncbi:NADH dehydrogenase [ubiquinone] 1 alpha subcomplex subunit 3, partial [Saguinus oedipus]